MVIFLVQIVVSGIDYEKEYLEDEEHKRVQREKCIAILFIPGK